MPQKEFFSFKQQSFYFAFPSYTRAVCSGHMQWLTPAMARAMYFSPSEDLYFPLHFKEDQSGEKGIERWWIWHGKHITEQSCNIRILLEPSLMSSHYNCLQYSICTQPRSHFLDCLLLTPCSFLRVPPTLPLSISSAMNSSPFPSTAHSC